MIFFHTSFFAVQYRNLKQWKLKLKLNGTINQVNIEPQQRRTFIKMGVLIQKKKSLSPSTSSTLKKNENPKKISEDITACIRNDAAICTA